MAPRAMILLSLVLAGGATAQSTCYDLAGSSVENVTPCTPNEKESLCCGRDQICLANNLCYKTDVNELDRGV